MPVILSALKNVFSRQGRHTLGGEIPEYLTEHLFKTVFISRNGQRTSSEPLTLDRAIEFASDIISLNGREFYLGFHIEEIKSHQKHTLIEVVDADTDEIFASFRPCGNDLNLVHRWATTREDKSSDKYATDIQEYASKIHSRHLSTYDDSEGDFEIFYTIKECFPHRHF